MRGWFAWWTILYQPQHIMWMNQICKCDLFVSHHGTKCLTKCVSPNVIFLSLCLNASCETPFSSFRDDLFVPSVLVVSSFVSLVEFILVSLLCLLFLFSGWSFCPSVFVSHVGLLFLLFQMIFLSRVCWWCSAVPLIKFILVTLVCLLFFFSNDLFVLVLQCL